MEQLIQPLNSGDRGLYVRVLHLALAELGFEVSSKETVTTVFGPSTTQAVARMQEEMSLRPTGTLDKHDASTLYALLEKRGLVDPILAALKEMEETLPEYEQRGYHVSGRVTDEHGKPVRTEVRVLRVGFRSEEVVAEAETDVDGRYYTKFEMKDTPKAVSLMVEAEAGKARLRSPVLHNVTARANIDLSAAETAIPVQSELGAIREAIEPVIGDVKLGELRETETQSDISFLAADRDLDANTLARAAVADRVAEANKLSTATVYAFLAQNAIQGIPETLSAPTPSPEAADALDDRIVNGLVGLSEKRQRKILADAIAANQVPFEEKSHIDKSIEAIEAMKMDVAGKARFGAGKASMNEILDTTELTQKQRRRVLALQLEAQKGEKLFWDLVKEDSAIPKQREQDLRYTMTLGSISKNHLPFMTFAKKHLADDTAQSPGLLAAMMVSEWEELIKSGVNESPEIIPDNIDGDDMDARIGAFAQMLTERAEQNYPTVATVASIAANPDAKLDYGDDIMALVTEVPDIKLKSLNIAAIRMMDDPGETLEGRDTALVQSVEAIRKMPKAAVSDLMTTQRALRLAPGADAAAKLIATGNTSAHEIHALGKTNFITKAVGAGMTELQASQTFGRAAASYGYLVARFLEYRLDLDKASPQAAGAAWKISDLKSEIDSDPSLRTLFGSLDSCYCEWCESVHGPAAYYTDVLRWLGQRQARTGSGFATARDVLRDRRPDLFQILLNCDNADTVLPYIDLVNEVLEEEVAPTGAARNTTRRSELLMAEPEHVNDAAYALLATARHAPGLPFDLPHAEAQTYLEHLQVPRYRIIELFSGAGLASSYFGVSETEAQIVTTAAPGDQSTFWAMTAPGELLPTAKVQVLLGRADISYENLADLLACAFINADEPKSSFQPEFECDLSERTVINLSNDRLDRMNRFVRLWRQIGWQIWELDLAIMALGGALDGSTLDELMRVDKLVRNYGLSVEEALAMTATLNTRVRDWLTGDGKALYPDLFQNLAVMNPPDADLSIASVTAAAPPANLEDKADLIAASLGIARADLDLLMPEAADPDIALPVAGDPASLSNLSQIFRFARLAKALGERVADLLTYCRLADAPQTPGGLVDPFQSFAQLEAFLETYERHAKAQPSITETRHIITTWAGSPLGMSDADIGASLEEYRTALADLRAETLVPPEERAAALERQLPGVSGFEDVALRAAAISIVDDTYAGSVADLNAFITANFGPLMSIPDAITAFAPYAGPALDRDAAIDARRLTMLTAIYGVLARNVVTVTLAAQAGLDDAAAAVLAWQVAQPSSGILGPQLLAPEFLELNAAGDAYARETTRTDMPDLFVTLALLDKIATAADVLDWSTVRLLWMLDNGGSYGLPDLRNLPVEGDAASITFAQWMTVLRWTEAMNAFPETDACSLPAILDQVGTAGHDVDQLGEDLAVWAQTDASRVASAITELGLAYPADFRDVAQIERLFEALEMLRKVGVPAAQLAGWGNAGVSAANAQEIKLAAKARYDLSDWLEIAVPLQDRLREAKRVALVTYLTSRSGPARFADSAELYAHCLIDPEMSSCRTTSRLVLATGAVQLFIQRCLMNLESSVVADAEADDDWNQWDWMSSYRIWEAGRKVFLWPENVIRPELNMHKSPQLIELEQKLAQGEITAENAEVALEAYLETLDRLANLEVVATHEQGTPKGRMIRVLSRTKADPPEYYYREQLHPNGAVAGNWSAWQKVDLDIKGEPFFGFVNRKVYIFWLTFLAMPDPAQVMPPPDFDPVIPPHAKQMWQVSLNWSMFRQGKWQPPLVGGKKLFLTEFRPERSHHVRTATYSNSRLAINVYGSTSPEFNERPLRLFNESSNSIEPVDQDPSVTAHDPSLRPRHLARFVFKRDIDEVQLSDWNNRFTELTTNPVYGMEAAETKELQSYTGGLPVPQDMGYRHQSIANTSINRNNFYVTGPTTFSRRLQDDALLEAAPDPFRALPPSNVFGFNSAKPFFYADRERSFFVRPSKEWLVDGSFTTVEPSLSSVAQYRVKYVFDRFYHPFTSFFLDELATGGLKGFYKRSTQLSPPSAFAFPSYQPDNLVTADHTDDIVDFGYASAYGDYNWELFFHVPWLLANRLAENQRFDEALDYIRCIFNPTDASSEPAPQRYWITKPFHLMSSADYNEQRIDRLLEAVNSGSATHVAQVEAWRDDPFDPHLIARLRPVAYQRAIVMAYVGLLLDWGDREFRRFSTESLNLASLYYVRALELLGRRPETVPVDRRNDAKTFDEVEADLDAFGNVLAEVENLLPPPPPGGSSGGDPLPPISIFYFCIPGNDKLLDYWDRVERNLFNLRNCRDIDGIERPLPLFSPPIDPAMLVRAAAAGVNLSTLAGGMAVALPHYRFSFMVERAYTFVAEVERLGGALLQAMQSRDAAELEELRETHLEELHKLMRDTAELRIEEAEASLDTLKETEKLVKVRKDFFEDKKESWANPWEYTGYSLKVASFAVKLYTVVMKAVSGGLALIPEFQVGGSGGGGSPQATAQMGGKQASKAPDKFAESMAAIGGLLDKTADVAFKTGYFNDRQKKYKHEYEKAEQELHEVEKRIIAAKIDIEITKAELAAQEKQIEQARAVGDFLTSRYTNKSLYDWMVSTISSVYFQAYGLAYDMALAAGACAEREVGLVSGDYISFGYWDSLRKGLLSGEKLSLDLRRLEAAYLDRNKRLYEVSKDISLALLDADALLELRSKGACEFEVPEMLYDMDHPGHYKRRIRSVAITIPTAAGAYTNVNAKLVLLRDEIRMSPSLAGGYPRTSMTDDSRFADNWSATRAIVTSKAVYDHGLHELSLDDPRYLPFEGAGAVGTWRLELPADTNAFNLDDVTDAVLHIRYTAEEGGETLATEARAVASQVPSRQGARILRLDEALAAEWSGLTEAAPAGQDQSMTISFTKERLPYLDRGRTLKVTQVILCAIGASEDLTGEIIAPGNVGASVAMTNEPHYAGRIAGDTDGAFAAGVDLGDFQLKLRRTAALDFRGLTAADLDGLYAIFVYDAAL